MQANELMIGDWVYEGNNHPIQVVRNYSRSIMYKEEYSNEVEEKCLNPIHLTEEILKANGFIGNILYAKENIIKLFMLGSNYPMYIEGYYSYRLPAPEYVHQLQHALRLCGLSEQADNFKIL